MFNPKHGAELRRHYGRSTPQDAAHTLPRQPDNDNPIPLTESRQRPCHNKTVPKQWEPEIPESGGLPTELTSPRPPPDTTKKNRMPSPPSGAPGTLCNSPPVRNRFRPPTARRSSRRQTPPGIRAKPRRTPQDPLASKARNPEVACPGKRRHDAKTSPQHSVPTTINATPAPSASVIQKGHFSAF